MNKIFWAFIFFLVFICIQKSWSQEERILQYDVVIKVNENRSLLIHENIIVQATGNQIKRGIYRSLPKKRNHPDGKSKAIRYKILEIKMNGKETDYHTRQSGKYETLYIGKKDVFLEPGKYQYSIKYLVPNQVDELTEIDEIYWNAIGQFWDFPIDKATCKVNLPNNVKALQSACYTGTFGSTSKDCAISQTNDSNELYFELTKSLKPQEGMTIGVGFEKGAIKERSFIDKFGVSAILSAVSLFLIWFFITTWLKHGIDPPKPVPYPIYQSPDGLSAASIGYILNEHYSNKTATASIISLAINGFLKINQENKSGLLSFGKQYSLESLKEIDKKIPIEEKDLFSRLLSGKSKLTLDGKYNSEVKNAFWDHRLNMLAQHQAFVREGNNQTFLVLPILLGIASIVLSIFLLNRTGSNLEGFGSILFSLAFILLPVFFSVRVFSIRENRIWWKYLIYIPVMFIFVLIGCMPFIMGITEINSLLHNQLSGSNLNVTALALFIPFLLVSILTYSYLIKQPTIEKLDLQSRIEGFKMYLQMAEKDRMNLLNPPDRTPKHFEEMLPYAFALGVENDWAENFKSILDQASYEPQWSNDPYIYYHMGNFGRDFGQTARQTSTQPTQSGGGSGGGGFSGGGGGGGGGGGW
jgi:uncharacterized membrane protein YgcG